MYIVDASVDEPIMLLNKRIGGYMEDDGYGIDGGVFQRELFELDGMGKKCIHVYINCPGGEMVEGMNIYNAILKSKTPVDTHNVGIAASMGAAIYMAGRKRYMADYAKMMIHNPSGAADKAAMTAFTDALCTMTASKCNVSEDDMKAIMKAETWLGAAECFEKGLCTEVEATNQKNKKWVGTAAEMWSMGDKIVACTFKKDKTIDMKKVIAKFNLGATKEDAAEDAVIAAIEGIEGKVTDLTGQLATANQNVTALTTERDQFKLKAETLEAANKTASETAAKEKATTMVTGFAKVGRIKNEQPTIDKWVALAIADFDGTKKMIEELPLNKTAAEVTTETGKGQVVITAQMKMINIAAKHKQN